MMSGIRGKNTKPEILVRSMLHRRGFRFRLHVKNLPGKPDIVLPRFRAVVLVHGCFWHGHPCPLFKVPATRSDFWKAKISRNMENDLRSLEALREMGWRVAIVWECAIRGRSRLDVETLIESLAAWLQSNDDIIELTSRKER